ncbi:polysaccharide deacetylase family protein [Thalassotalea euphylliae]|uniref:polysaccharide deacetylase family protein n=1 Tax=Thalassotalea euphylliae TaxID=1655234 RepID=UPI00362ABAAA
MRLIVCFVLFIVSIPHALSAVILQYHHVSTSTPASTSISPAQFEVHMQYLKDNGFTVVPLSDIVDAIKNKQTISDKTVAITFDDAYLNILENGTPILDKFNYPYTIFVNPSVVERKQAQFMTWEQLKTLADKNVIIANHGWEHDSLTRIPDGLTQDKWLAQYESDLKRSETLIEVNVGQSYRYFAYPYGEYSPEIQQWLTDNKYVGFSQQSGAVGIHTDLSAIPRFPASQPYDKIPGLRDKLNSLPFNITLEGDNAKTMFKQGEVSSVTFNVEVEDFHASQINCYISGLGRQKIKWLDDDTFTITFNKPLPVGRVRCNCTAPSIEKPGRYYWFSKPWFILNSDGAWYPL